MMIELTERQKRLLTLVIREHIRYASPVASQTLVDNYALGFSSATVRNELAELEAMGYLRHAYKSAGRVPSEEGYRYFVSRLLQETELPGSAQHMISHQFAQMRQDVDQWMRLAASVLAKQSHAASLVTAPHSQYAHLKHLELISTRGRQVLMVLVILGGEVRQRLINMAESVAQDQLTRIANQITLLCQGKEARQIEEAHLPFSGLDQDVLDIVVEELHLAESLAERDVYMDGVANVLNEPEFSEPQEALRAVRVLEERTLLHSLVTNAALPSGTGGVQILIGGEGTWEDLRQWSVILSRYGTPGLATGTLGVMGPMRMSYGRAISTVRYLSGLLTDMVNDLGNER